MEKEIWNEILLEVFDFQVDMQNVVQCPVNICENNLIFIMDDMI